MGFYAHLFLGKPDIGYFNFSSFGLKQWNKGKPDINEKHSPFLLGFEKGKYHGLEKNKVSIS